MGFVPWGSDVPSKQFVTALKECVVSCQKEAQLWFAVASFCCPSSTPCPACSTCPCACVMLGCDFPPLAVWCDQLFSIQSLMSFYKDTNLAWTLLFMHLVLTRGLSVGHMTGELNPLMGWVCGNQLNAEKSVFMLDPSSSEMKNSLWRVRSRGWHSRELGDGCLCLARRGALFGSIMEQHNCDISLSQCVKVDWLLCQAGRRGSCWEVKKGEWDLLEMGESDR